MGSKHQFPVKRTSISWRDDLFPGSEKQNKQKNMCLSYQKVKKLMKPKSKGQRHQHENVLKVSGGAFSFVNGNWAFRVSIRLTITIHIWIRPYSMFKSIELIMTLITNKK